MGTDIYLVWKGMTEKDKDAQITGWSINAGNVGYLRASIGMVRENTVLRILFPEKYWYSWKPLRYKFTKDKLESLDKVAREYIKAVLENRDIKFPIENVAEDAKNKAVECAERGFAIVSAIAKTSDKVRASVSALDFRRSIMWLNSLYSFFELGYQLEEAKKNPKIYISW
jgi:hypothetical protein